MRFTSVVLFPQLLMCVERLIGRSGGAAIGYAQFVDQNGMLTANVTANGLEPGSTHPLFVRKGTCEQQGNTTFHGLYPLVADSTGSAKSTTEITGVSAIPSETWYVVVYRGTNLDSYIDSAPILCGNVEIAPQQ